MGKIKSHIEDFLENGGDALGYDWENLPDLKDFDVVLQNAVKVWEYRGYPTEQAYYS